MVPETLLRRRAAQLGVGLSAAVREFAVLSTLELLQGMQHPWVLRGGTALAYGYFDVHRLSEDLDFTAPRESDNIDGLAADLCRGLSERLDTEVVANPPALPLPGPELRRIDFSWGENHRLQIDFAWYEPTFCSPESREVKMPYPGFGSFPSPMWALEEIMANKWFILDGRAEPRDLFDLWFGLTRFDVDWSQVVQCHRSRYGFGPILDNLSRYGLSDNWEPRLGNQIRNLPSFEQVEQELRRVVSRKQGE